MEQRATRKQFQELKQEAAAAFKGKRKVRSGGPVHPAWLPEPAQHALTRDSCCWWCCCCAARPLPSRRRRPWS